MLVANVFWTLERLAVAVAVVSKAVVPLLARAQLVRAARYQDKLSFRMSDSLVICF